MRVDRRRGVVVSVDVDKLNTVNVLKGYLRPIAAAAMAKGITKAEAAQVMAEVYDELM